MTDTPTIEFDVSGLSDSAREKLITAAKKAGVQVRTPSSGGGSVAVKPGQVGTIETSLSLNTRGLDDAGIEKLRETVYSSDRHSRILDSVLKGALAGYGIAADGDPFLEWVWCQWLQYNGMEDMASLPATETFNKRYAIRPPASMLSQGAATAASGESW